MRHAKDKQGSRLSQGRGLATACPIPGGEAGEWVDKSRDMGPDRGASPTLDLVDRRAGWGRILHQGYVM